MTPELERALREEDEVSITTYDADGKPGSVPIWFVYVDGKVYMATGRESLKTRKLRADPRVRLRFGNRIALDGAGRICAEKALVERIAPLLNGKYGNAWGANAQMVNRLMCGDSVLLEITPVIVS
jgi:PPOX class probable F420-dependent enzyme